MPDKFLAALLATCPDTIYVYDLASRRATFRTQRLYEALGYDASEVEAPHAVIPQQFLHDDDRLDADELFARVATLREGEHVDVYLRLRDKGGAWRQFRSRLAPMEWRGGEVATFVGVLADTTAAYEAERLLRHAKESAEDASAAKTRFLADMSHEIRTPLHTLIAALDLLGRSSLTAEQAHLVNSGQRAGRHLAGLVNDAIDLAAIEAGRLELQPGAFAVTELVSEVAGAFGPRAGEKGLSLLGLVRPGVPDVLHGDARRIRQMLCNLVGNAVKFTEKGAVQLVASAMPAGKDRATLRLAVSDSGPGLTSELQTRLFQRFSRGDHAGGPIPGAGLGLAIVADLAKAMGGTVGVRSRAGEGAAFWVELPMTQLPAESLRSESEEREDAGLPRATVLVVDDSPDNLRMTERMLAAFGLAVIVAPDGETALEAVRVRCPDLILMDCQMPGMDGIETVKRMRAGGVAAPVLGLTANITPEKRAACDAAGFDDVLTKPMRMGQLARRLQSHLRLVKEAS